MARISDRLVVQLVGDDLVVTDDTDQEIRIPYVDVNRFLLACDYLRCHAEAYNPAQVAAETERIRIAQGQVGPRR